jgi:hypothetical protein
VNGLKRKPHNVEAGRPRINEVSAISHIVVFHVKKNLSLEMKIGKRSVGQVRDFSLLPGLRPTWRDGILKKFLVFFGDFHQTDSHAKGIFVFINAVQVSPNDLTGETDGLTIWRYNGHAEIFVHAEGFIASHIDPA